MRVLIAFAVLAPLGACNIMEDDVARTHDRSWYFNTPSAYMTADARIVTQREHPVTHQTVVCVEPSPDAIKAIATSGAGGLKGGNGAVTAGIDLSGTSAEAAGELAGRSTALLGLREGLFRACEAYANGIIGGDAYGLILAKYAPTMTTLFLGQDIIGAAGVARTAVTINAAPSSSGTPAESPAASDTKPNKASFLTPYIGNSVARIWQVSDNAGAGGHDRAKSKKQSKPKKASDPSDSSPSTSDPAPSSTAALALLRMNEDYILQPTLISTLLVACIEQYDPTRLAWQKGLTNQFLIGLCQNIKDLDSVEKYSKKIMALADGLRIVEPTPLAKSKSSSH